MKEQPTKKPAKKTAMRLPAELHAELKNAAEREEHSMNDEIIARLTATFRDPPNTVLVDQNKQLMDELKRTQDMVQTIIDAIGSRRARS